MPSTHSKIIASLSASDEERLLLAHMEELLSRSGNAVVYSAFLNPGEQYLIRSYFSAMGKREGEQYLFFGGNPYVERRRLFCFPEYFSESILLSAENDTMRNAVMEDACYAEKCISAVSVSGSGYKVLGHRDYLGSLLSLGIERSVIGDIAVTDDAHAVIFADSRMSDFLTMSLTHIGADKVRITPLPEQEMRLMPDTHRYASLSDTVASLRLDGLVASFTNLSREKAKELVTGGFVDVNFRTVIAPDTEVPDGACLSVRGYGRYRFLGADGQSKKGRLRIHAQKYI